MCSFTEDHILFQQADKMMKHADTGDNNMNKMTLPVPVNQSWGILKILITMCSCGEGRRRERGYLVCYHPIAANIFVVSFTSIHQGSVVRQRKVIS